MTLFNTKTFAEKMETITQAWLDKLHNHYCIALDFLDQCKHAFHKEFSKNADYWHNKWDSEYWQSERERLRNDVYWQNKRDQCC
jgi:hypothetical protein